MTRRDGWLVTYRVEIVFDTDNDRTRYDHVGTTASCACCGECLALPGSSEPLVTHAKAHIGVGRAYAGERVTLLVKDLDVRSCQRTAICSVTSPLDQSGPWSKVNLSRMSRDSCPGCLATQHERPR